MPEDLRRRLGVSIPAFAWLCEPLSEDLKTHIRQLARTPDIRAIAVMPDVHVARDVCVGVAFATHTLIYPQAVGGDIGCGISAVRLSHRVGEHLPMDVRTLILKAIQSAVPILRHPSREVSCRSTMPDPEELSAGSLRSAARRQGVIELGSLGRGNHFFELQQGFDGDLWLVVHSGSRAMGQLVREHHMRRAVRVKGGLRALDIEGPDGGAYLRDADWCVRYAAANRHSMLEAVARSLNELVAWHTDWPTHFGTSHNCVRQELVDGRAAFVHRKGASDAGAAVRAIIPGSMGSSTYFVQGLGNPVSLHTSSHGAGRVASRTESRRRITREDMLRQLGDVLVDPALIDKITDEAPAAYKDIVRVMRAQADLVRIDRVLKTLVSHKGV